MEQRERLIDETPYPPSGDEPPLRCVGCGVRGRWVNGTIVNAERHEIPARCPGNRRGHGPFIPA